MLVHPSGLVHSILTFKHYDLMFFNRLDDTEFIISARQGSKSRHNQVDFYGKLEIRSLDWLSSQGKRWLEQDLRERDRKIHFEHALSGLTLDSIYGDGVTSGMRITVWIMCEKNMQSRFLGGYISMLESWKQF